jgi:hypothetical protein
MRYAFFCLFALFLTACVTTHSVDLQHAAGDVQVLFGYPKDGEYTNLGAPLSQSRYTPTQHPG